jgi:acyl carrier protein
MPPEQALSALEYVLGAKAVQKTVADIDWSKLKPIYETRRRRPFLEAIDASSAVSDRRPSAEWTKLIGELKHRSPSRRRDLLVAYIQDEVRKVLGFDTNREMERQQGFFEMGMDSLTSVELKTHLETSLGRSLPPTLVFEYSTIEALAGYIEKEVLARELPAARVEAPEKESDAPASTPGLEKLSKDELLALIADELAGIDESKSR